MKRTILALALVALPCLSGCMTPSSHHFVGSPDYQLARRETPDGAIEVFHLRRDGTLRVETQFDRERPFLGLQVEELDGERAERRGVDAFSGLLVTGTYPGSSARLAGVLENDVLLMLDGDKIVYLEQLRAAEAALADGQEVLAQVLRGDAAIELTLQVQMLQERVNDSEDVVLESPPQGPRPYAGVTLRGVPALWCERIFDEPRNAVVITRVEVGSPAWLAGIRGGDVIEAVDGEPCPPVNELSRLIAARGSAGEAMTWRVRREPGTEYEAAIALADYGGQTGFGLPLVFDVSNSTYESKWRIALGLLMKNRNHYVADSSTRDVQTRNLFSAVFGLFKVDDGPRENRVRLLWFIRFNT